MDQNEIKAATAEASKLVKDTVQFITQTYAPTPGAEPDPSKPRLFFPGGVELIYFKLSYGKDIQLTVAVAGEKAKYPAAGLTTASDGRPDDGPSDGHTAVKSIEP